MVGSGRVIVPMNEYISVNVGKLCIFFLLKGCCGMWMFREATHRIILAIRSTKLALGLVIMTTEKDVYIKAT